jgi:hypothetical protein
MDVKSPPMRGTRSPPGWMKDTRLTSSSGDSTKPIIAVSSNTVHVVWSDNRNGHYEIYYKNSTDNGLNWGSDTRLTTTSYDQLDPKIAISGNNIHLVWYEDYKGRSFYRNSTDNGNSWGSITSWDKSSYPPCSPMGDGIMFPDIAVDGNNVYISAFALGPSDIIFKRSTDNGNSWSNWIFVDTNPSGWYGYNAVDTDGNLVHILWELDASSGDFLYHFYSYDNGDNWTPDGDNPIVVVDATANGYWMGGFSTSMNGNEYVIAYNLFDMDYIIPAGTYKKTWHEMFGWIGTSTVNSESDWCVDVNKNHVVCCIEDINNHLQIYSSSYGQITDYPSDSIHPSTVSSGNIVHVVWVDNRDGNNEIYYSQRGLLTDLIIDKSDIQFAPSSPVINDTTVFINVSVFSYGKASSNVKIKYYMGNPDTNGDNIPDPTAIEIGNDTININKDSSSLASIQWTPPLEGTYDIYVWADPGNSIPEYNYTNNLANKILEVLPGIFTWDLEEGWNLISIPLRLSENDITTLLQPIDNKYDAVQWFDSTDNPDHWKHFHISKPVSFNDLNHINESNGFWINITEPGGTTLTIIDNELTTSPNISLYKGWNLVGYPSLTNHNRTVGLNTLEFGKDVDTIQWFNATSKTWHFMEENHSFEIGKGYWIHTKSNCVWEVPL